MAAFTVSVRAVQNGQFVGALGGVRYLISP